MATQNITMTGEWVAVAGEGNVTVTLRSDGKAFWAIGSSAPSGSLYGHRLHEDEDKSFSIGTGETLYVLGYVGNKGGQIIAVTADTPA